MSDFNNQQFFFNEENEIQITQILNKYPITRKKSALLPLLELAQKQNGGWLSKNCMEAVGEKLNLPFIYVKEVASFYSMFFLEPVGKNVIEICQTLSCKLCGAENIKQTLQDHLNIKMFETTKDNLFTLRPIECLGACVNAPVVKINDNFYEDLNSENIISIVEQIKQGKQPPIGSQNGRISCEPNTENTN